MEILWFLVLFPLAASLPSGMEKLRLRSSIRSEDIGELEEKSRDLLDFRKSLDQSFGHTSIEINGQTFKDGVFQWRSEWTSMNKLILSGSKTYLMDNLKEYCALAVQVAREKMMNHTQWDISASIRFADDRLFCPFTAFHDIEWSADWMLSSALSLETVDFRGDVELQLRNGCRMIGYETRLRQLTAMTDFAELDTRLRDVKRKIGSFSGIFCTRWKPFMSHRIVAKTANNVRNQRPFMDYVLRDVKCIIHFESVLLVHGFLGQEYQTISSWTCDISKIQEYGYPKYIEGVTAIKYVENKPGKKTKKSQESVTSNDVGVMSADLQSNSKPSRKPPIGDGEFSLAMLRDKIQSNGHYLNVVKYYNIALDVVLSVSIREGQKMFKGIRRVLTEYCEKANEQRPEAVGKMLELKSKLSAFTSALDRLVSLILDEKRIDFTNFVKKKAFDKLATSLVSLLSIGWTLQRRRICRDVLRLHLKDYQNGYLPVLSFTNFHPSTIRFEQYYLTEPLLNVNRLFQFVANEL